MIVGPSSFRKKSSGVGAGPVSLIVIVAAVSFAIAAPVAGPIVLRNRG